MTIPGEIERYLENMRKNVLVPKEYTDEQLAPRCAWPKTELLPQTNYFLQPYYFTDNEREHLRRSL